MKEKVKANIRVSSDSEIQAMRKALSKFHDKHGDHEIDKVEVMTSKPRGKWIVIIETDWFGDFDDRKINESDQ